VRTARSGTARRKSKQKNLQQDENQKFNDPTFRGASMQTQSAEGQSLILDSRQLVTIKENAFTFNGILGSPPSLKFQPSHAESQRNGQSEHRDRAGFYRPAMLKIQ
jgi:hypothetical protein